MSEAEETPAELERYERHRAMVRETDKRFATVYGAGGAAVLACGAVVLVVAWVLNAIGNLLPWVLAPTVVLIALFVLRNVVNKQRETLWTQVLQYCEVNDLDGRELRDYYEGEGLYPYFCALFTDRRPRAQ